MNTTLDRDQLQCPNLAVVEPTPAPGALLCPIPVEVRRDVIDPALEEVLQRVAFRQRLDHLRRQVEDLHRMLAQPALPDDAQKC